LTTATITIEEVLEARKPEEIFGAEAAADEIKSVYKRLARDVHPDQNDDERASDAFVHLGRLYELAKQAFEDETYGTSKSPMLDVVKISSKRNTYDIRKLLRTDQVASYYDARFTDDDGEKEVIIKVSRDRKDNDLMAAEAKNIKAVLSDVDTFDEVSPYIPAYIETFGFKSPSSKQARQASVFKTMPDYKFYTLEEVRQIKGAIDPRDMAWMFRRLLFTLGFLHSKGVIHGAILPPNILIQPEAHGVILDNWVYSVQGSEKIKAIIPAYREWYPREVLNKELPGPGTDIYMAVQCMNYLLGGNPELSPVPQTVSRPLRSFFRGCTSAAMGRRPQSAAELLDEFNELIERMWGPRRFRPFDLVS